VKFNGHIGIFDETGNVVATIPVGWLHPKHMTIKDLNYFGQIWPGFVGAAQLWVDNVEQLCDTDGDGETNTLPIMPSVVVLNYGYEAELDPFNPVPSALPQTDLGDLTRVYEATPFAYGWMPCVVEFSGNVVDEALDPVDGAEVFINGDWAATTDVSGFYSFEWGSDDGGVDFTLEVDKSGYWSEPAELKGVKCDDQVVNFQVITCDEIWVKGHVFDNETGLPIEGAFVTAINDSGSADGLTERMGSTRLDLCPTMMLTPPGYSLRRMGTTPWRTASGSPAVTGEGWTSSCTPPR
jgi:hypothetical protein